MQFLAGSQSVADFEIASIGNAHDIAGVSLIDNRFLLRHKSRRSGKAHHLAGTDMLIIDITLELPGAYFHKRYATAVVRVHIRVNLENESRESRFFRTDNALLCLNRLGRRSYLHKTVEQFLNPERIQRRPEKHRGNLTFQIIILAEFRIHAFYQFQIIAQLPGILCPDIGIYRRVGQIIYFHTLRHFLFVRSKQVEAMLIYVIYSLEFRAYINRPAQRTHFNLQFGLKLVENVERVAPLSVKLVYKNYNRSVAHTAHFHQFPGLLLYSLGHIDYNNYTVDGRKRAVSVLRKILVTGRVENIYLIIAVIESHHGRSHRYSALLLYLHPVGRGGLFNFIGFYRPCNVNCTTKQQQFLCQSRFTRIRVTDNGECAPTLYFFFQTCHVCICL